MDISYVKAFREELTARNVDIQRMLMNLREVFISYASHPKALEPDNFHILLIETMNHNMIHYSRLSAAMGISDPSNSSRWFYDTSKRKTPDRIKRIVALDCLKRILQYDIERFERGESAIGGLPMKTEPHLGIAIYGEDYCRPSPTGGQATPDSGSLAPNFG